MQKQDEKQMRRWGKVIDMDSYVPGSFIRLVTLVISIFIVPLQLFADGYIRDKEQSLIVNIQSNFAATCQQNGSVCSIIMSIPHLAFEL